ncbi:Cytochrome P450 71B23 [Senna tora]|uniref:Cytochrome P450 71B23 n=1 Tax=Senna tora TaxID=362788 RepID=A0A834WBP6_9FABA|nr:Cytochrome P450 71B23 [Senna tora]
MEDSGISGGAGMREGEVFSDDGCVTCFCEVIAQTIVAALGSVPAKNIFCIKELSHVKAVVGQCLGAKQGWPARESKVLSFQDLFGHFRRRDNEDRLDAQTGRPGGPGGGFGVFLWVKIRRRKMEEKTRMRNSIVISMDWMDIEGSVGVFYETCEEMYDS